MRGKPYRRAAAEGSLTFGADCAYTRSSVEAFRFPGACFCGLNIQTQDVPRRAAHRGVKINAKAYLPTLQACSQAASRFPCTHGNQGRPQGHPGSPRPWAQSSVGLIADDKPAKEDDRVAQDDPTTMKPGRLKNRPDFLAVQKGKRLRGPFFLLETLDRGACRRARPDRFHRDQETGQRGRAQPHAPQAAGSRASSWQGFHSSPDMTMWWSRGAIR
jgi:hypothetical protein